VEVVLNEVLVDMEEVLDGDFANEKAGLDEDLADMVDEVLDVVLKEVAGMDAKLVFVEQLVVELMVVESVLEWPALEEPVLEGPVLAESMLKEPKLAELKLAELKLAELKLAELKLAELKLEELKLAEPVLKEPVLKEQVLVETVQHSAEDLDWWELEESLRCEGVALGCVERN